MPGIVELIIIVEVAQLRLPIGSEPGLHGNDFELSKAGGEQNTTELHYLSLTDQVKLLLNFFYQSFQLGTHKNWHKSSAFQLVGFRVGDVRAVGVYFSHRRRAQIKNLFCER